MLFRSAKTVLSQSYPQYKVNAAAWKPQVEKTITAAAEFKQNLGPVTKTEFTTPFDSLISSSHIQWLDWLDIIIRDKGDKEDALLLFPNFQAAHPGLEHFAGVVRGGTFILVFDSTKRVIGDFMLPYHCCEVAPEIEPQEPVLPLPPIKTPGVIRGGIKLIPTADKYFTRKLTQYTQNVIDPKINYQKEFVKSYTDSLTSVVDVLGRTGVVTSGFPQTQVADPVLNASMVVTEAKRRQLDLLKGLAVDTAVPVAQRTQYTALMRNAEAELAKSIQDTVKYVSDARLDVSPGSEAFHAVSVVSAGIAKISHEPTINSMNTALTEVRNNTANAGLKNMLAGIAPS